MAKANIDLTDINCIIKHKMEQRTNDVDSDRCALFWGGGGGEKSQANDFLMTEVRLKWGIC